MKRMIIASVMVAAAIFTAVFGYADINSTSRRIIDCLNASKQYCSHNDYAQCISQVKKSVELWKENENRYKVYLNHEELDELEICFEMLRLKSEETDTNNGDFESSCKDITELLNESIFRLNHLIDSQKPRLSEVL